MWIHFLESKRRREGFLPGASASIWAGPGPVPKISSGDAYGPSPRAHKEQRGRVGGDRRAVFQTTKVVPSYPRGTPARRRKVVPVHTVGPVTGVGSVQNTGYSYMLDVSTCKAFN